MPDGSPKRHHTSTEAHRTLMMALWALLLLSSAGLAGGWWAYYNADEAQEHTESSPPAQLRASSPGSNASQRSISLTDLVKTDAEKLFQPHSTESHNTLSDADTEAAAATITKFKSAKTWHEKLAFVFDAGRVTPLMRDFYDVRKQTDPVAGELLSLSPHKLLGREIIVASMEGNAIRNPVEAALLQYESGNWKLDWESYVGFGEMAWEQFILDRTTSPKLFRVQAQRGDYWNFEFSDENIWYSVKLRSPESERALHAYCRRDSGVGAELMALLQLPPKIQPLCLRLVFPERSQSDHCVEITGLAAERWLILPP